MPEYELKRKYGISPKLTMPRATNTTKRAAPQRSNSTKVSALNMMKSGVSPKVVSETLKIPKRTLHDWKSASIKSGNWFGAEGDNGLARPAKRRSDLGSGTKNRKVTEELKRKIGEKLERNPFLTAFGLQKEIPGLRDVKLRTIRDIIKRKLDIPSRLAAKKPFLTDFQKARSIMAWLSDHNVPVLEWVGQSAT